MKRCSAIAALVIAASLSAAAATESRWDKVPPKDHARTNPMTGKPQALQGGAALYKDHCAQCHGEDANGTKKRPPLRSERVQQQATEGDIHWLLVNGNMKKGMPSWAKLPDQQLWQVTTYVRSLHE